MSDENDLKKYITAFAICALVLCALIYVNTADAHVLDLVPVVG
jgi:hypothetical protein